MKTVDLRQRSPAWHEWRSQGVSASDAPAIMGRSPHKTVWRLWAERRGIVRPADISRNPNVRRGLASEPLARRQFEDRHGQPMDDAGPPPEAEGDPQDGVRARGQFEDRHGLILLPVCGESEDHPLMRASFDGIGDDGMPVEIKCPADSTFAEVKRLREGSAAYQMYWCQVQHQILVAGSPKGHLYFWLRGEEVDFEIPRDDAFIDALVEKSMDFWAALKSGREPAKDPVRDIYIPAGADLDLWTGLAAEYRNVAEQAAGHRAKAKELDERLDGLESRFCGMMGGFVQAEAAGLRVNQYVQKGAVDYKAALNSFAPDVGDAQLERFRRTESDRVKLTLKGEEDADVPFSMGQLEAIAESDWYSSFG
jgi:hypothetical protein